MIREEEKETVCIMIVRLIQIVQRGIKEISIGGCDDCASTIEVPDGYWEIDVDGQIQKVELYTLIESKEWEDDEECCKKCGYDYFVEELMNLNCEHIEQLNRFMAVQKYNHQEIDIDWLNEEASDSFILEDVFDSDEADYLCKLLGISNFPAEEDVLN